MSGKMTDFKHDQAAYDDDDCDLDEEYFSRTYQPLSNLPTPPPSCRDSITSLSPRSLFEQDELFESALLGPAVHLVNLIPPKASLATPSVPTVHEILTRANLPSETIALAVCILDSLNAKFSLNWRQCCPLARLGGDGPANAPPHIDAVRPEVIVLAALIIAVKFLEDCQEPTHHYASSWGNDLWSCEQINLTERCIMESLGYRIMPLWDRELIKDALADMERAGRQAIRPQWMGSRKSVSGVDNLLTPAETLEVEHVPCGGAFDVSAGGAVEASPACGLGLDHLEPPPLGKPDGYPFPSASTTPPVDGT